MHTLLILRNIRKSTLLYTNILLSAYIFVHISLLVIKLYYSYSANYRLLRMNNKTESQFSIQDPDKGVFLDTNTDEDELIANLTPLCASFDRLFKIADTRDHGVTSKMSQTTVVPTTKPQITQTSNRSINFSCETKTADALFLPKNSIDYTSQQSCANSNILNSTVNNIPYKNSQGIDSDLFPINKKNISSSGYTSTNKKSSELALLPKWINSKTHEILHDENQEPCKAMQTQQDNKCIHQEYNKLKKSDTKNGKTKYKNRNIENRNITHTHRNNQTPKCFY